MTSEQLNIKLQLDISDITAGVRKVKSQLSGMANTVKQSIPRINTESKRAEDSLSAVGKAGDKVKKSMTGIGDEAKKSLSGVVAQVNRVTQAFNTMGIANRNTKTNTGADDLADSTGQASFALEDLKDTMDRILSLDFFGILTNALIGSNLTEHIRDLRLNFKAMPKIVKEIDKTLEGLGESFISAPQWLQGDELKEYSDEIVKAIGHLNTLRKNAVDTLHQSLITVIEDIRVLIKTITVLSAALAVVALTINALQISKLGKQIYTTSQQAGFSAQAYQEWAYVLEKAGIEATELGEIMKTLTESQVDVIEGNEDMIKAYAQLGMSVEDVKSMNQEELWNATIKALQNVENTTLRTSIAYKLFSEDTAKLTTVLNLSNEQTQQLISSYNQLGGAMSKELIHNSNVLQGALLNLRTAWEGLKNTLAQYVIPVVIVVVEWLTKAIVAVSTFLKAFFNLDTTPMTENLTSGMNNASSSIGGVADSADTATKAMEKLRRTTMGFDELNIVTNPNASASDDSSTSGTGTGSALGDIGNINTGSSIFLEASEQAEALKKKITDFVDEFKVQIATVGAALGTLGIAKLLGNLGEAIGLGDKFLAKIDTIKNIAKSAITIVLQYALVNEFMDAYMDGKGFKNYIMGLVTAAIGTGILYKMWGPTGLVIGLGVTAVASLKAVFDNGGITDVESATVALTGLASAIGAVAIALKKIDFSKITAAIAPAKTAISTFTSTALVPATKAVGTFVSGLSTGAILGIAAIIAAIASAAYFLYENWEKVTKATQDFIDTNIKPILDEIKDSWEKMKTAVSDAGKAIANAIPDSVKQKLKEIGDAISDVVTKVAEWFKSIDWLEAIGKAFEGLGAIVVSILGGAIAGAIQGILRMVEGLVQAFSGVVQIISGAIEAIVKLFEGDLQGAWDACKKIWDGIVDLTKGLYDATIGWVVDLVEGIIDWCIELWDELVGHSIIPDMVEAIIDWFETLYDDTIGVIVDWAKDVIAKVKKMWDDIKAWFNSNIAPKFTKSYWNTKFDTIKQSANEKLAAAKKAITDAWNGVASWFKSNVAPKFTLSYWQNKFDTVRKAASEKMNAAKSAITSVWSSLSGWFSKSIAPKFTVTYWANKFNTIKDGARSAFNGLISIVERAINGIISKLNTISWTIPYWVPVYGGSTFGFNLRQVSIPRLAEGGIATSSVLANIGENGKEAVLPLENNTGWMDILAEKIAARQSAPTKVALVVDGKELGWATINNINAITKQTGGLQLAL